MSMKFVPGALVAAISALFLLAGPSLAQTEVGPQDQTRSDQYACNHGAPDDPRTIDACARLRGGEGSGGAPSDQQQAAPNATGAYPYPAPRYTAPHYTPPADQDEVAAQAAQAAKAAKIGQSEPSNTVVAVKKAEAPPPTDVGEAPLNADQATNEAPGASADDDSNVSIHPGHWLAGLGAFAVGLIILGCLIVLPLHFLPTIIAIIGHKRSTIWIFVVNLFFGWTVVGWVVALVWALASERER
jgi:hypothetical protein